MQQLKDIGLDTVMMGIQHISAVNKRLYNREVSDKKVLAAGNITIKTKTDTYKFQINRCVLTSHKIRENTRYIEENNYFYNQ